MSQERTTIGLAAATAPIREYRLLYVEDDPVWATWVKESLLCFQVEVVSSLADGLVRLARDPKPSVVLLDTSLPDAQGIDTVRKLCLAFSDVPVVAITAHDNMSVKDVVLAGADMLTFKGYVSGVSLRDRLLEAMARHEANKSFEAMEGHLGSMLSDTKKSAETAVMPDDQRLFSIKRDSDVKR